MKKLNPYITEKSVELTKHGKFTLEVDYNSTKKEIESLVKQFYKVSPLSVKVLKSKYLASTKHRKNFLDRGVKKAIIELDKGQKIPGFDFEKKETKETKEEKADKIKTKVTKVNQKKEKDVKES